MKDKVRVLIQVWSLVYKVGRIIRVGVRGSQGLYPLCHLGDREGVRGSTKRGASQGGDPAGLELGAVWAKVALTGRQTMGRPYFNDTAQTEVRLNEDPPDQIRAVESRGGTGGSGVGVRGWV